MMLGGNHKKHKNTGTTRAREPHALCTWLTRCDQSKRRHVPPSYVCRVSVRACACARVRVCMRMCVCCVCVQTESLWHQSDSATHFTVLSRSVQMRIVHELFSTDVFVQNSRHYGRRGREQEIEENEGNIINSIGARKPIIQLEPVEHQNKHLEIT